MIAIGPAGFCQSPANSPSDSLNKVGFLEMDSEERFNTKRSWRVQAWRIVDAEGKDLVQPWFRTQGEAKETAKALGISLKK